MKLIAHRGNIQGPNNLQENNPNYIETAIKKGYDIEIDIRYNIHDKKFYLGHDLPQYPIEWDWLFYHRNFLWIHCKNIESLYQFSSKVDKFNYFWHEEDSYTLTSLNYIWTYPGKEYNSRSVVLMPEKLDLLKFHKNDIIVDMRNYDCYAICSDYVSKIIV